jgi:energy-coupling factor transport system ATP-binding protein
MLELASVTLSYGSREVLSNVDLRVAADEFLLVAGPTGSGKSSLLGVMAGLIPRFGGGNLAGSVLLNGINMVSQTPRERAHLVGFVGQNPLLGFVTDTVEEELAYTMEELGLAHRVMRRRVEETLDLLGISQLRHRELSSLSGGQQQRVAIGSVLTAHPQLLILDEPTSALDPTAAEEVLSIAARLVHDLGISVVLAEHRLERVLPFVDRVAVLSHEGRVSQGTPELLGQAGLQGPPILQLSEHLGWSPPALSTRAARRLAAQQVWGEPRPRFVQSPGEPLLTADRVSVSYGPVEALRGVSMTLRSSEVTALLGRNGSGKSTLLWALQGAADSQRGRVTIPSMTDPPRATKGPRNRGSSTWSQQRVGLVPQNASDLLFLETVGEECRAADPSGQEGRCVELLDVLAPGISLASHPRDLSEGQQLALVLAIVLSPGPSVVLLDEPTRGLDYRAKAELGVILRSLAAGGAAVLVTTHDVEFAARVADQVAVLAQGELIAQGPAEKLLADAPSFAPQLTKILGPGWLTIDQVRAAQT